MELHIQKALNEKTWEEFVSYLEKMEIKHHIEVSQKTGKSYLHMDYDIFASKTEPIVKECRGIVFLKDGDKYSLVRLGFMRFMNWGESGQDQINAKETAIFEEKVDGSIIFLNNMEDEDWTVGTRGRVFADQKISGRDISFEEMFWQIFGSTEELEDHILYLFELCGPENRIVVPYSRQAVLIGARDKRTWRELQHEELDLIANKLGVKRPDVETFSSIEESLESAKNLPGYKEGYVVKQWSEEEGRYKRAKIKGTTYLDLHRIVSCKSLNNLVRLVIRGDRESISFFPEYLDSFDKIRAVLEDYVERGQAFCKEAMKILEEDGDPKEVRKKFALSVVKTEFQQLSFLLADGKITSPWEWLESGLSNKKTKMLIEKFNIADIVDSSWEIVENEEEDV